MTREALAQLYAQHGALVFRRCRALLGNDADANDALQETFMRVQRYPPQGVTALLPWLYGVAARVCFDQLDRHRRRGGLVTRLQELFTGATSGSVEAKLCLGGELLVLDEVTREMALLHWLDGMTQDEVAAQTGYSRKTVGTKLKAAATQLSAVFGGSDV